AGQSPAIDTAAMPPKDLPHAESDLQSEAPGTLNAVLAIAVGAAQAMLPAGLLASGAIAAAARTKPGAASGLRTDAGKAGLRGRSLGIREGLPGPKTRLHLLATIRAAAPWQRVRERADDGLRLRIDRADLRVHRFAQSQRVTTVFVVDASGSAALHRLAEVKGAVELLLAQCYVRRDQVAVIAFRLDQARLLLPPTRSLTRAKRQLSALPGGGGTPLASALSLSAKLLENWRKQGQRLQAIVLSDGKANIDIEGKPGRGKAMQDALQQAALLARLAAKGTRLVWVDTAPRPSVEAQSMAQAMAARYMTLPYASAQRLVSLAN
ncbi:MAG: VWA domain-containing protein, partial [Betaproteobacteria bacterium]|nr:VWA domain-containing protein [Betaproteobacteria bacterium]